MTTATPPPTGPFGWAAPPASWTDAARADPYAAGPVRTTVAGHLDLVPAKRLGAGEPRRVPAARLAAQRRHARDPGRRAGSHSADGAPVAADRAAYPVVLLSPSGFAPLLLSATAEELASHGFVVVGVNHTYETEVTAFADGRVGR